jgi:hypothetical protein
VTDEDGEFSLPLYAVIEPHAEYLLSASTAAWQAYVLQKQLAAQEAFAALQAQLAERRRQQQEQQEREAEQRRQHQGPG